MAQQEKVDLELLGLRKEKNWEYEEPKKDPYPAPLDVDRSLHDETVDWWGPPGEREGAVDLTRTRVYPTTNDPYTRARIDRGEPHAMAGTDVAYQMPGSEPQYTQVGGLANTDYQDTTNVVYAYEDINTWDTERRRAKMPPRTAAVFTRQPEAVVHEDLHIPRGERQDYNERITSDHDYIDPYIDFVRRTNVESPGIPYKKDYSGIGHEDMSQREAQGYAGWEYDEGAREYPAQRRNEYIRRRSQKAGFENYQAPSIPDRIFGHDNAVSARQFRKKRSSPHTGH